MKEKAQASPEILKKLSAWAKGHGYAKVMGTGKGYTPGLGYKIANAIFLSKIK